MFEVLHRTETDKWKLLSHLHVPYVCIGFTLRLNDDGEFSNSKKLALWRWWKFVNKIYEKEWLKISNYWRMLERFRRTSEIEDLYCIDFIYSRYPKGSDMLYWLNHIFISITSIKLQKIFVYFPQIWTTNFLFLLLKSV